MSGALWHPGFRAAATDRRLAPMERAAVIVLWEVLSPAEWRPCKAEALASLLGIHRPNAARILRRLIDVGYVVVRQAHARAPREFLLVNVMPVQRAA